VSNIDELIQELCPDGVSNLELGEVVRIRNGRDYQHLQEGNIPVYGSGGVMKYVNESFYQEPSVLIPRKGSLGNLFFVDLPFWTVDTIFYTEVGDTLEPKYLFYFLKTQDLASMNLAGGVPSLTQTMLNKVMIPVPPLTVQREIVEILDKFTQLEAELEAELSARQRQFRYFCDLMFETVDSEQQFSSLGEMGSFHKGGNFQKSDFSESGEPCIHYGQIHTRLGTLTHTPPAHIPFELGSKLPRANPGDLVIADTAEDLAGVAKATAWLGDSPISLGGHILVYKHHFDPAYISFFFQSSSFQAQKNMLAKGVKVKDISSTAIAKIKIPIHSLSRQKQISKGLSSLQVLLEGSVNSLPAEIAARRQQYEYYRDKLLTFKELDVA
jgi:type I restriction enzyme S subunit